MAMTKKDFIALADELRPLFGESTKWSADSQEGVLTALTRFRAGQNPNFKHERRLSYLIGECGSNGDALKRTR